MSSRRRASARVPGGGQRRGADRRLRSGRRGSSNTSLAWGAAFPSSHVAVAVAATAVALLEWRVLGLALVVPTTLLTLGSVYGQFHYAVDALAGIGVGLAVAIGAWLVSRKGATAIEVDPGRCMTRQPPMPPGRSPEQFSDVIGTPRRRPRVDRDGTTSGACRTRGPRADWTRRTVSPACESGA